MTQEEALKILKTGANVFLTGEPGSGKTHLINQYISWLHDCNIFPAVTASTGIAATHIGGMTIHSWSGIGIRDSLSRDDLRAITAKKLIKKRIINSRVLIIDEVSMLSGNTLGLVDAVCQKVREVPLPFGGLQVVLVGDFFQLPPISRDGKKITFAYDSDTWRALNPTVCYLNEQYRQDDTTFLAILSAIRKNTFDETHHTTLLERYCAIENAPDDIPKLFSHNIDVHRINSEKLNKLSGKKKSYKMEKTGAEPLVASLIRSCLSPEVLELKIGASIICTKNSLQQRFVNGTLGTVLGFDSYNEYPVIRTRNGATITVEPVEWAIEENGKIRAKISQIPLRLAWAMTVHKSQGMSMDGAVIDLSGAFEYGQGYVALSRVRKLSGLYLLGINERAYKVHPEVLEKDKEFRASSEIASKQLETTNSDELLESQRDFIKQSGGTINKIKNTNTDTIVYSEEFRIEKRSNIEQTQKLICGGNSVEETAKILGLKPDTVITHIEKLLAQNKINRSDFSHIAEGKEKVIKKIHEAFQELSAELLKPIFDRFNGQFSYTTIKIARLLFEKS